MSVEHAQKSEVHETTDDATSSPANRDADRAGDATTRGRDTGELNVDNTRDRDAVRSPADTEGREQFSEGPGASDGYSGGSPGSNNPGAETALRAGEAQFKRGNAEADRDKLFPGATSSGPGNASNEDETCVRNDPDESSFGGPLRIDDREQR